jgi:hypothetical protein
LCLSCRPSRAGGERRSSRFKPYREHHLTLQRRIMCYAREHVQLGGLTDNRNVRDQLVALAREWGPLPCAIAALTLRRACSPFYHGHHGAELRYVSRTSLCL